MRHTPSVVEQARDRGVAVVVLGVDLEVGVARAARTGASTPVKPGSLPARARAYRPFGSRRSHSSSGGQTKTSWKSRPGRVVQLARELAVGRHRRDERDDRDHAGVGEQARDVGDAADVLAAVAGLEAEVVGEPVADVVAVEQVRGPAGLDELALERDRDRRLARGRQPGQPDRRAARSPSALPALLAVELGVVPGDVAPARPPTGWRSRAASIMPAPTVSLVCSSMRMNAPVMRLSA